jgi:hypothetical protein
MELNANDSAKQSEILNAALKSFPDSIEFQQLSLSATKSTDFSLVKSTILSKLSPKNSEFDAVLADIFGSDVVACNDLLDLAHSCIKNGRPVQECVKYVLKHDSLEALLVRVDTSRLQSAFLMILLTCLMQANLIAKAEAVKFLNKVTIFCPAAYKNDVDLCLLLARCALISNDLELLTRVSSQASLSEEFNRKFEELKASIY